MLKFKDGQTVFGNQHILKQISEPTMTVSFDNENVINVAVFYNGIFTKHGMFDR